MVFRPQSNGIVDQLHRALLDELLCIGGRKIWLETVGEVQTALATPFNHYNKRPHQGRSI